MVDRIFCYEVYDAFKGLCNRLRDIYAFVYKIILLVDVKLIL